MYAIVTIGGKQYRVEPEAELVVERISAEPGETVEFGEVAMVEREGRVRVGTPYVRGAKVTCRVMSHGRGRKVEVFFYKAKENWKRSKGHRQPYTRLRVSEIVVGPTRGKKEERDGA